MPDQVVIVDRNGVEHEFPAGFDPMKAAAIVRGNNTAPAPTGERPRRSAMEMLGEAEAVNTNPEFMQGQAQAGGAIAPLLMGAAGGILGGIPGAGMGAAAGGALRDASQGRPITARGMLTEGALGAAGQAAGPLIGQGIQKTGRFLARLPVIPTVRPSAAIRREYGGMRAVADDIIEAGSITSKGAHAANRSSRAQALRMVRSARGTAPPIQPAEALDDIMPVARRSGVRYAAGLSDDTTDDMVNQLANMETRNPGGIRVDRGQTMKEELQDVAGGFYKSEAAGITPSTLKPESQAAIAKGMQRAIERRVPGVRQQNAQTQRMMAATRALREAEDRPHKLGDMVALGSAGVGLAMGNPIPLVAAAGIKALDSPAAGAAAGIAIDRTSRAMSNPQAVKAALLSALLGPDYGGE